MYRERRFKERFSALRAALVGMSFICTSFLTSGNALAQLDVAVHGDQMMESEVYGLGATFLVPLKGYRYDVGLGGQYYFSRDALKAAFAIDLDVHTNLFVLRFLRPYTGVGLGYLNRDGHDRVGLNLKGGIYISLGGKLVPYVQYVYRTVPSFDQSNLQAGFRFLLRRQ